MRSSFLPAILGSLILTMFVPVYANDITSLHNMPPIHRAPNDADAFTLLKGAKVLKYADGMPVNYTEIMNTAHFVNDLRTSINDHIESISKGYSAISFNGVTGSELNIFLKSLPPDRKNEVLLTSRIIYLDEPITLPKNTIIKGSMTKIVAKDVDIAFIGKDIFGAGLRDLIIEKPKVTGIMLLSVTGCIISNVEVSGSLDKGMVVRGQSSFIKITHSRFKDNVRGGILVHNGAHHILIDHCDIYGGKNSSNWAAGVIISSVAYLSDKKIRDAFDQHYFYPKDLSFANARVPFKNIVEASHIHNNQSSGVYVDGGNGNAIIANYIETNDKEGICLDFYAVGNIVESNILTGNGFRKFQSDDDLRLDGVLKFGRLADRSAASKLPNISLDNAAYNVILHNTITGAAGDGIKIVRSGFRNIIGLNSIADNNAQENSVFSFFGVLLGSADSDSANDTSGIDALPSIENIVFGNTIYGSHRSGILIDRKSVYNDIYDNMIMKQKGLPIIEQDSPNSIVGNNFNMDKSVWREIFLSRKRLTLFAIAVCAALLLCAGLMLRLQLKKQK